MNFHPEIEGARRHGLGPHSALADEAVWSAGWAVATLATAAVLLLVEGAVPARDLLALGLMALPGIIGALWRPMETRRFAFLVIWSVCMTLAVCLTGGLSGPLAVLCVTPVLACLVVDGSWRAGLGLSLATAATCALAGALHPLSEPLAEPARSWLTLMVLLVTAVGAGAALLAARRRGERDRGEVEAELVAFQSLMGDLPELALVLDAGGRVEAVFGRRLDGVDMNVLHTGLTAVAAPGDRPALDAALQEALATGAAQASFDSISAPGRRVVATLRRSRAGGLTAILRATSPAAVDAAPADPAPLADDVHARLAAAEAGRREAEEGRERAEAAATARARFLANMSHELRTPLNAIMGFSDIMRAKLFGELTPKYAEYADLIHESGGHLLDLINDVLDMSKIEAQRYTLSPEVFDVRDALNASLRLVRLQAEEAGVKLRTVFPPEPLLIDADKRATKQIALNLLSNALKFTPHDGTVLVSAQAVAGVLEIVVADTGMGIAAEDLERLGRPFEQAGGRADRARGTGLGLSLVDAFAKLHGGSLTLESRLGEGTAATVRMPVLAKPQSDGQAEPSASDVDFAEPGPIEPPPPERSPSPASEPPLAAPPASDQEGGFTGPAPEDRPTTPPEPAATPPRAVLDPRAAGHEGVRRTVADPSNRRPMRPPET